MNQDTARAMMQDPEAFAELWFLSAVGEGSHGKIGFHWAGPRLCDTCAGGRHYANIHVISSLS